MLTIYIFWFKWMDVYICIHIFFCIQTIIYYIHISILVYHINYKHIYIYMCVICTKYRNLVTLGGVYPAPMICVCFSFQLKKITQNLAYFKVHKFNSVTQRAVAPQQFPKMGTSTCQAPGLVLKVWLLKFPSKQLAWSMPSCFLSGSNSFFTWWMGNMNSSEAYIPKNRWTYHGRQIKIEHHFRLDRISSWCFWFKTKKIRNVDPSWKTKKHCKSRHVSARGL